MILLGDILGQPNAVALLRRLLERDRVPHALLFQGPEGVGKSTTARALAASLLCTEHRADACGDCSSCRATATGQHPDQRFVERLPRPGKSIKTGTSGKRAKRAAPAEEDLRQFIIVDQIRELTNLSAMAPRIGRRRVFLVDPADRMNREAQNALLKTLEEPPGDAVLILISNRPAHLLATVRSRCFQIRFGTLGRDELARLLEDRGLKPREARLRACLAEGRPGRALSIDLEELDGRRSEMLESIETLVDSPTGLTRLPGLAGEFSGATPSVLAANLELMVQILRDVARSTTDSGESALVHADLAARLRRVGHELGTSRCAQLVSSCDRLRSGLHLNPNRKLVAESLLAAIAGGPLP